MGGILSWGEVDGKKTMHKMGRFCASVIISTILLFKGTALQCSAYQDPTPPANALLKAAVVALPTAPSTPTATPPMENEFAPSPRPLNITQHPCTCGVFLSNQFKKGSLDPPTGAPALRHEQEKIFPCNLLGTKQCQNKCLEVFIKHLPKAGSILCASMNRDCYKEKAYLFVQNCSPKWINSNLTTGREYCCKDGVPYQCPLF